MSLRSVSVVLACLTALTGCQVYEFVFEPSQARQGVSLRFEVATPSRADILFVVDNSESMREQQAALASSFEAMLEVLAPADNSYRIGLVATDAHGFQTGCCGELNPLIEAGSSVSILGARGNCERCGCDGEASCVDCDVCEPEVVINRPHDGVRGRLMAAYDPAIMSEASSNPDLNELTRSAVAAMLPASAEAMPAFIDRDTVSRTACEACGCADCADRPVCSLEASECIADAGSAVVSALFRSNLSGLGVEGFGWEEGLKSALWAVGIDPEEPLDADALEPGYDLLGPAAPNAMGTTETVLEQSGSTGWTRDDAVLALLFVTDEDDCSAPAYLMERRHDYEVGMWPTGSFCYMPEVRESLMDVQRMADLLTESRGGAQSRLVVGVIGGLEQTGEGGVTWDSGRAAQCRTDAVSGEPSLECSCLEGASEAEWDGWCELTGGEPSDSVGCNALSASRYTDFASNFRRGVYESICRGEAAGGYVDALERFSALVTESCFELDTIVPAARNGDNIRVTRLARERVDDPEGVTVLEEVTSAGVDAGWYYDATENKVCLSLIERRIGDHYEIFVYHEDVVDYRQ